MKDKGKTSNEIIQEMIEKFGNVRQSNSSKIKIVNNGNKA